MIDSLSLLMAHVLMFFAMLRVFDNPDLNVEPSPYGRRFKQVGKKQSEKTLADKMQAEKRA